MATELISYRESIAEAPAFPTSEYVGRLARARRAMAEEGAELMVLFDPQSVCYFTGYSSVNLWDNACVVVPADGPIKIVIWEFELGRFEATGGLGDPVTYPSHGDFVGATMEAIGPLRTQGIYTDRWSAAISSEMSERLVAKLARAELRDARRVLQKTRLVKSSAELDTLRRSAAITDVGVAAAADAVRSGITDREIAAVASDAMLRAGSGHFSIQPIVTVGPRAGVPHSESSGRRVQNGEGVFLEFGASINRYTAPVMRTVAVGNTSPEFLELANATSRAIESTVAEIRPGVTCSQVAETTLRSIAETKMDILFHGYVGYPVGISFPPSWLENLGFHIFTGNDSLLQPGMAFHIPISLRVRGKMGVGLSYTVVVTNSGSEILTGTAAKLIVK